MLYPVEVLGRERFGNYVLLRYRWTREAPEPGQFVMINPRSFTQDILDPFLNRPFFAHDYSDGVMSLLFEVRGRGTALLAEEDTGIAVSGPLGRGFTLNHIGPVALVGGGVWVSPLKLLFRRLLQGGVPHEIYLEIPESASEAYAAWISDNYPGAILVPTQGSSEAPRILLDRIGDLTRYSSLYASGPAETLSAVKHAAAGKVPAQLATRERMACGNGSCHGCAIPIWHSGALTYARSSVEGPIFPAEVLVW